MGSTAVLHPQDYLAALQRERNSHFFNVTEFPSPVARFNERALPAVHEASIPLTKHGRDAALCRKIPHQGRSLLGRKNSLVGLPGQALPSAHNTNRSSHAPEAHLSRQLSVPRLDHAARAQRLPSERFHLHGVQLHERRLLRHDARFASNSAQGVSSCAGTTAISCQKLQFSASSHFHDAVNSACLQLADSFDPSFHYRKRLHPELSQVEACLGSQCAKPPFADGQGKPICTYLSIVGTKVDVHKQLNRSASEKVWERSEPTNLWRPVYKGGNRIVTSLSEGAVGAHTGKSGSKLTSSTPSTLSLGRKIEESPGMQVYLDADTRGGICRPGTAVGSEGMMRAHASALGTDEMWEAMMNDERWAGPSFFNSPPPSSLPVPSFTGLCSRAPSTGSIPTNSAGYGAQTGSDKSSPQANSCTWDVAFATKDLRRMLRLDNASFDL